MQDQDPNKPGDDEFFEEDFEDYDSFDTQEEGNDFGSEEPAQEYASDFEDPALNDGWDDFNTDEAGGDALQSSGKSGGLKNLSFNTIVIGIALIVGAGVLVYQVMTTKPSGGGERFQSALNFTGSTDGPVLGEQTGETPAAQQAPATSGDDQGFLNNPGVLDNIEQETAQSAAPPMPSPISNDTDDQGMDQQMGGPDPLTPMPATQDGPPAGIAFDESQSQQVPRAPETPAPEMPAPVAETTGSSPALDVIRQAQSQQQQRPEQQPAPVEEIVPPAAEATPPAPATVTPVADSAPAPSSEQTALLIEKLDALTERLSVMEQQIVQIRESGQNDVEQIQKDIASLKQETRDVVSEAPAKKTAAPAPKKEPAAAKPAPKKQAAAPAAKAPTTRAGVTWELRAAQPGRAWVSRKGEREMQSVSPGDSLSGIGQVTRIEYAGGRWTVFGTQGQIRQ